MSLMESPRVSAQEIRRRLRNPPNSHLSSELDILAEPLLRRARIEAVNRADEHVRAVREARARQMLDAYVKKLRAWVSDGLSEPNDSLPPRVTFQQVIHTVGEFYDIHRIHMTARRRVARFVRARHVVMYLTRELTEMSMPQIGFRLGGRDHTTVLHGVRKISAAIAAGTEPLTSDVAKLRKQLEGDQRA